jgi:hypothetical protein
MLKDPRGIDYPVEMLKDRIEVRRMDGAKAPGEYGRVRAVELGGRKNTDCGEPRRNRLAPSTSSGQALESLTGRGHR